jgi:ankyrin repeat protein
MINSVDSHLMTPLHLAAHQGKTAVVVTLLNYTTGDGPAMVRAAKVNCTDVYRRTPLHIACSAGHQEIVTGTYKSGFFYCCTMQIASPNMTNR